MEGIREFIKLNITNTSKFTKLIKLFDYLTLFEFTTNTLNTYFNEKMINQTQSILFNIAITLATKIENK